MKNREAVAKNKFYFRLVPCIYFAGFGNKKLKKLFCCITYLLLFLMISCNQKNQSVPVKDGQLNSTASLTSKQSLAAIAAAKKLLKDGMLVTRSDNDFESLTLQNFSQRERIFSHSGIVFEEGGGFVVYHSMAGIENPNGACRRDAFDSFVSPLQKTGFGLFKYDLTEQETGRFHQLMQQHFDSKIPFDVSFDLKTNDSLYCSEMICKDLKIATSGRVEIPVSVLHDFHPKIMGYKYNSRFYKTFEYIGIDDLYLNPFCKEIARVKY